MHKAVKVASMTIFTSKIERDELRYTASVCIDKCGQQISAICFLSYCYLGVGLRLWFCRTATGYGQTWGAGLFIASYYVSSNSNYILPNFFYKLTKSDEIILKNIRLQFLINTINKYLCDTILFCQSKTAASHNVFLKIVQFLFN